MSVKLAKLTATYFYLNELQKLNLVTPSIAKPHPGPVVLKEALILHKCYRNIQLLKINNIKEEIRKMEADNIRICKETLIQNKCRFRQKINFLKNKFNPVQRGNNTANTSNDRRKTIRKRKSKERYVNRKFRKKLIVYKNNPENRTVINLSSTNIPIQDLFALEIGHGFVLSPNNKAKEEETLFLEGFRFIDRLGKADKTEQSNLRKDGSQTGSRGNSASSGTTGSTPQNNPSPTNNNTLDHFIRDKTVPQQLQTYQPKEVEFSLAETKIIKKEFSDLNTKIINSLNTNKKRIFNLPKTTRDSINRLKTLVKEKVVDIRKVDKGQLILIVDYEQRILTEKLNISKIANLCDPQVSNWEQNKQFVETKLIELFSNKFITKEELAAVTGLLAGGVNGKLQNKDKSMKFTRTLCNSELFAKQRTPYVYPLFKAHKLSMVDLLNIPPDAVHSDIPSRLVVGMSSCQLSRVQTWIEHLLTPLSKFYGNFEYIKDSGEFLSHLENIKAEAVNGKWNWNDMVLFTVDVEALYPSVKFNYLRLALKHCFDKCTSWEDNIKNDLINIIIYTMENQQIYWDNQYYILNQGITTGGKHSVPIANIFLTSVLCTAIENDLEFQNYFGENIKIWKRFIDDCFGILKGSINEFFIFFDMLKAVFDKFGLKLTCDTDSHKITNGTILEKETKEITFLDMDIFKADGTIHSKEHRKETSVNSYLPFNSAHPRHTFSGIVKSQLFRLRRLCSRNTDFKNSVEDLKIRCLRSGYKKEMVESILSQSFSLERNLIKTIMVNPTIDNKIKVRLVILSGTWYEKEFTKFAKQMNSSLSQSNFKIEIVKGTAPTIGQYLFNNNNKSLATVECRVDNCLVCPNELQSKSGIVKSVLKDTTYKVDKELSCNEGGIYVIQGICTGQYTGKTINFGNRCNEHFKKSKLSSIHDHMGTCQQCNNFKDFSVTYVEGYFSRGKYSLSEREMLWNDRIKGVINVHKTLKSS